MQTVLALLRQTPGFASVRSLEPAETARLLEPWLGASAKIDELPVPRLVDLQLGRDGTPDIAALRRQAGLSQKELARRLKTSQQQISRLESPGYVGHSLATLRRVAHVFRVRLHVVFEPTNTRNGPRLEKSATPRRLPRTSTKRT